MKNILKLLPLLGLLTSPAYSEDNVLVIKNVEQRKELADIAYYALLEKGIVFESTALCESNECAVAKNAKKIYQLDFSLNGNCCTARGKVSSNSDGVLRSLASKKKRACIGTFLENGDSFPPSDTLSLATFACHRAIKKVGRRLNNF